MFNIFKAKNLDNNPFNVKSKCIQQQYENFMIDKYNISMVNSDVKYYATSDYLTFYLSFKAMKSYQNLYISQSSPLPGLDFNIDQLFWIGASQKKCSIERSLLSIERKALGEYPLDEFRVVNSLRNNEEFGKSFSCSKETPMNLDIKC